MYPQNKFGVPRCYNVGDMAGIRFERTQGQIQHKRKVPHGGSADGLFKGFPWLSHNGVERGASFTWYSVLPIIFTKCFLLFSLNICRNLNFTSSLYIYIEIWQIHGVLKNHGLSRNNYIVHLFQDFPSICDISYPVQHELTMNGNIQQNNPQGMVRLQ